MGAPLTADEEAAILAAWYQLESICAAQSELTEPLEMLDFCTDLVMATYEVRRAIGAAWNDANARAFPTPPRQKPHKTRLKYLEDAKDELDALGLNPLLEGVHAIVLDDPKQLHNILAELFGEEPADDQNSTDNT
jgi:hypothetical protein